MKKQRTINLSWLGRALIALVGLSLLNIPASAVADSPPGNLIQNPDMETAADTQPLGWTLSGYSDTFKGTYPVAGPQGTDKAAQIETSVHVDGDAKWIFDPVTVEPGARYTFSDWYKSDQPTTLVVAYTTASSSDPVYEILDVLASSSAWKQVTENITVPQGKDRMTVYHVLSSVGTLATAHYSLTFTGSASENVFQEGMVSLTLDDGWSVQYDNAWPILKDSGLKSTLYMISDKVTEADTNWADDFLATSTHPEVNHLADAQSSRWFNIITDPSAQVYRMSLSYQSDATSTISVSYDMAGTTTVQTVGTLAPSAALKPTNLRFTLPINAGSTISPIAIEQRVATGTLQVSNARLARYSSYMTKDQMLEMQAGGVEIGNHTVNHCNLVTGLCPDGDVPNSPDALTAQQEISQAHATLTALGASPLKTLAYPYGAFDDTVKGLVSAQGIETARSTKSGYNTKLTDKLGLNVQVVDASTTLNQAQSWVDTALNNKWWLILLFHQIEDRATIDSTGATGATTPEIFSGLTSFLKQRAAKVVNMSEGAQLMASSTSSTSTPQTDRPAAPQANPGSSSFTGSLTISLSASASSTIRYTLDGTDPSCSSSTAYISPIVINETSNVKAVACQSGLSSSIASFTYNRQSTSGGGGGGGTPLPMPSCSAVEFGPWGACFDGRQFRNIISSTPHYCTPTPEQAASRSCGTSQDGSKDNGTTVTTTTPFIYFAHGTLLRLRGDSRIYVVYGHKLRRIVNLGELSRYRNQRILTVEPAIFSQLEYAEPGTVFYADGTLLRERGTSHIYVIKNGQKKRIMSLLELRRDHSRKPIITVERSLLDKID